MNPMMWLVQLGASDCERLGDEFLVQPVNALSSFSYVVVGVAIAVVARRRRMLDARTIVFAVTLAGVGLGSVAFHGPQPPESRLMHDLPIVVALLFMVLQGLCLLRPGMRWVSPFVIGTVAATVVAWFADDAASVMSGVLVAVLVVVEALVFRSGHRPSSRRRQLRGYAAMAAVLVVAGSLYLLGRTDSPVCEPDSYLQPHGLWHVTSAIVFGLWWWFAMVPEDPVIEQAPDAVMAGR